MDLFLFLSLSLTQHTHTYAFLALENRHIQLFTLITAANGAYSQEYEWNVSQTLESLEFFNSYT